MMVLGACFLGFEIFHHSLLKDGIRFAGEKNIFDTADYPSRVKQIAECIKNAHSNDSIKS